MAFEEPGKPRYKIIKMVSGITISIPSNKNWFIILFIGFWLIGWALGEITVIGILSVGLFKIITGTFSDLNTTTTGAFFIGLFMLAWLGAWSVGGAVTIYTWLWQIRGFEVISISHNSLKIDKKTPIWTRSEEYRLENIVSLRVSNHQPSISRMSGGMGPFGNSDGQLAFDYGAKTIRFGIGVDEAEANYILNDIQKVAPKIVETINSPI